MRLSFISHEFPPTGGGAASAIDRFTGILARRNHAVQVLTISKNSAEVRENDTLGRRIIRYNIGGRRLLSPSLPELTRSYLALRQRSESDIQRFEAEAMVAYFAFPAGHAVLPLRHRLKIPLLVWLRGSDVPGFSNNRWGLLQHLQLPLIRPVLQQADWVAANGQHLASLVQPLIPERQIINLPNGIDLEQFHPHEGTFSGPLRLLFAGQWIERKRCLELLDGVAFMGAEGRCVLLTLAGDGPLRRQIETRAAQMPQSVTVKMRGMVPRNEMPELYRQHDLFVHLSQAEGVSNTLLEALASGLGVVASPEAIHGVLDNNPAMIVLAETTPEHIHRALADLQDNPERIAGMRLAARKQAKLFDWSNTTSLFERLLASSP